MMSTRIENSDRRFHCDLTLQMSVSTLRKIADPYSSLSLTNAGAIFLHGAHLRGSVSRKATARYSI